MVLRSWFLQIVPPGGPSAVPCSNMAPLLPFKPLRVLTRLTSSCFFLRSNDTSRHTARPEDELTPVTNSHWDEHAQRGSEPGRPGGSRR